jgi:hypothetical protein
MKSGTLTSWNPLGHSRPVKGLLYLLPKITGQVSISCYIGLRTLSLFQEKRK